MKRRTFLSSIATNALFFPAYITLAQANDRNIDDYGVSKKRTSKITKIGDMTLEELRDSYMKELFEEIIPLWYKKGFDEELGGFMCFLNHDGTYKNTNKNVYHQARGIWLYSYIYNHFDKDARHLRLARMTKDFFLKYCRDGKGNWYYYVTKEGKPIPGPEINPGLHVGISLVEYYRATGEKEILDIATEEVLKTANNALSPQFQYNITYEPGTSPFGFWIHFLTDLTQLCLVTNNERIDSYTRHAVRQLVDYHIDYKQEYVWGMLQYNLKPFQEKEYQRNVAGHILEGAWMIMTDALRTGNKKAFQAGLDIAKWTLEPSWDSVGGGGVVGFEGPEKNVVPEMITEKRSWCTDETLTTLIYMIEHTHDPWAIEWYDRVRKWAYKVYPDKQYNIWNLRVNREGKPYPDYVNGKVDNTYHQRWGNFHHPRSVMLNIQSLNRMIKRNGIVSDFLDT